MLEKITKFKYGKVQPVAFDDGMSLYEEVAKISYATNELIDHHNYSEENADPRYLQAKNIRETTGDDGENPMSQAATTTALGTKLNKANVVQFEGNDVNLVMSQSAVTSVIGTLRLNLYNNYIPKSSITNVTGDSESLVMSQRGVTEAMDTRISKAQITNEIGGSHDLVPSQEIFSSMIFTRIPLANIKQTTGTDEGDENNVMSQAATTTALGTKLNKANVVQFEGNDVNLVMSQSAVTSAIDTLRLNLYNNYIPKSSITNVTGDSESLVMSQKAITDKFNETVEDYDGKFNVIEEQINIARGTVIDTAMTPVTYDNDLGAYDLTSRAPNEAVGGIYFTQQQAIAGAGNYSGVLKTNTDGKWIVTDAGITTTAFTIIWFIE